MKQVLTFAILVFTRVSAAGLFARQMTQQKPNELAKVPVNPMASLQPNLKDATTSTSQLPKSASDTISKPPLSVKPQALIPKDLETSASQLSLMQNTAPEVKQPPISVNLKSSQLQQASIPKDTATSTSQLPLTQIPAPEVKQSPLSVNLPQLQPKPPIHKDAATSTSQLPLTQITAPEIKQPALSVNLTSSQLQQASIPKDPATSASQLPSTQITASEVKQPPLSGNMASQQQPKDPIKAGSQLPVTQIAASDFKQASLKALPQEQTLPNAKDSAAFEANILSNPKMMKFLTMMMMIMDDMGDGQIGNTKGKGEAINGEAINTRVMSDTKMTNMLSNIDMNGKFSQQ